MAITRYSSFDKTVNTIAERNAILNKVNHMTVVVKDAIADPSAGAGKAVYRWDAVDENWILVSKSTYETISFATEELTITNSEVQLSNYTVDNKVWNAVILNGNTILGDLNLSSVTVSNSKITGINPDFNGNTLRVTYAYGSISVQINSAIEDKVDSALLNNVKTINGVEIIGTGNIVVEGVLPDLKTINSQSIVGTGDITISTAFADITAKPTTILGYGITDAYTKSEVESKIVELSPPTDISMKADITYVDSKITDIINLAPATLDTFGEIAAKLTADEDAVATLTTIVNNKADNATTLSGYNISDAYTKTQTDNQIGTAINNFTVGTINTLVDTLNNKVDKVTGKQLSTEDYTTAEKTKLSGIAAGAQVNVGTDLSLGTITGTTIPLNSSTGTDVALPSATTTLAGLMSSTDKTKLDGLSNYVKPASEQISYVSGLQTALDSKATTSALNIEKGRIDAILLGANANTDTFAEVVTLINSVDTTNDTAFAGYVTSNNARSAIIEGNVTNLTSSKADKATTLAGYGITDAATSSHTHDTVDILTNTPGFMSVDDAIKLGGIAVGANKYSLPVATASVLGGVKAGTNISIDANGVISANDTSVAWSDITSKPTTLSGYGITDSIQSTLVSGTNIKTINGTSVLGSGDITISGGATLADDTSTNSTYYPTFAIATSGNMGTAKVSSTKLTFNPSTGTLAATELNSLSDVNKKENITNITNGLEIINKLNGVEFDWKENGNHSSGVIAQELEKVLPFLVTEIEGTKTVNYLGIIGYLINAVQELSKNKEA